METTLSVHLPLFFFRALVAEVFVDVFGTIGIEEALGDPCILREHSQVNLGLPIFPTVEETPPSLHTDKIAARRPFGPGGGGRRSAGS